LPKHWLASQVAALKETTTYSKVTLDDPRLSSRKGSYVLIIELDAEKRIHVGSLGVIPFPKAYYAYLGSALGGFKSRVNRHLIKGKKQRWHIDYLSSEAKILEVILCEAAGRLECLLSRALVTDFRFVPGFGSSDCRCQSHLCFSTDKASLERGVRKAMTQLALPRESVIELSGS